MGRSEIIQMLSQYKQLNGSRYGIISIGLFGSVARDSYDAGSDLDIVVELERADLFILSDIKQDIEEAVGRTVDIIRLRPRMNEHLRRRIESEAVYV
jgi:uncharacterized protein